MKKCKHCMTEIDSKAKVCPNCKKNQSNPLVKLIIVLAIIFGLVAGCSKLFSDAADEVQKDMDKEKENFVHTVEKSYVGDYDMGYYIEGTLKNNNNKDYSYVSIEFICYDKDGNNLGTAIDNTNSIKAGDTWKFKAMAMFSDVKAVKECKFNEVSAY